VAQSSGRAEKEEVMTQDQRPQVRPIPLAVGMLIGAVLGFVLWIATDTFALFPAFLGVGVGLGVALSSGGRGDRPSP
jgi:hypothetical protein